MSNNNSNNKWNPRRPLSYPQSIPKFHETFESTNKYLENTPENKGITVGDFKEKKQSSGSGGSNSSSMYAAYLRRLEEERQRRANEMYERNVAAMNNAFSQRGQLLKNNLDSTMQNLATDYNASKSQINADANRAAREAYINNMIVSY